MKKTLCLLLCICSMVSLASCGWFGRTEPPTENTKPSTQVPTVGSQPTIPTDPTNQTAPTDPAVPLPPLSMVSISLPLIHETTLSADGKEIFRYTFQDVALNITDAQIAKIITLDLLQRMDSNAQNIAALEAQANKDYTAGADWTPYYFEVLYTPSRIDDTVLSLSGLHSSYDGKSHPTNSAASANYSLVTGKYLALQDILSDSATAANALCNALISELQKIATEHSLFTGFEDIIRSSFSVDLNRHYAWFFTKEGICFYFSPYEIAPNSSGTVKTTVPYSKLTGILKDEYFPAEKVQVNGTPSVGWFNEADLTKFDHFAELIHNPDARQWLLWVDHAIYDVRLELGHWDSEANRFIADSSIFAANCMAEGDALSLRCNLSDSTPTLLLHYVAGDKPHSCYISKNHTTGAIVLTPIG